MTNKEPISNVNDQSTSDSPFNTLDNTDGRKQYEFKSKYPDDIQKEIKEEGCILFLILFLALMILLLNYIGCFHKFFDCEADSQYIEIQKYIYYSVAGMLGGIIFGMKYYYRVVARGYWHQDRKAWRLMSPFIAMVIAFITGTLIESGFFGGQTPKSSAAIVSIGFLAGYFADEAVGKMYEVANVIFGKAQTDKKTSSN